MCARGRSTDQCCRVGAVGGFDVVQRVENRCAVLYDSVAGPPPDFKGLFHLVV